MKMLGRRAKRIIILLLVCSLLSGCNYMEPIIKETNAETILSGNGFASVQGDLPIKDNWSLYENWDYDEVQTMYLTVRSGNEADGTNHTWEEVNTYSAYYYDELGIERYKVEGLLQVGDENGPIEGELGYGQYVPNSVVQIRGQTSTKNKVKNYRISIKDGKGDWKGQQTINLNKHVYDGLRFRNMLSYYWMAQIDGMMSARTKFVHLYVKDETDELEDGFVDYGLYTYVEQVNKSYLRNHNLDRNGQLYKVEFFEFFPYEDVIMLKSDADYDIKKFEEYLEIKGDDNHSKLIAMLQELNDYSIPIEDTFEKWFDRENYFTWLAFHILMGNNDTQSRNQFLYSPQNVNKFYFISWDNDGILAYLDSEEYLEGHEQGISNYWGNILHSRVLKSERYRKELDEKIQELRAYFDESKVEQDVNRFASIVEPYVYSMPDIQNAPITQEEFRTCVEIVYSCIEGNYQRYLDSLNKPMPFYLGVPRIEDDQLVFVWDVSYDFDRENITYKYELSEDLSFEECLYTEDEMVLARKEMGMLKPGKYFYRVTAKNESGYMQKALSYYTSNDVREYGVMCFWVTEDGEIRVDEYVED